LCRPPPSEWLVVSIWVDSQSPQELSVVRDDADVGSGDEESDLRFLCALPTGMWRNLPR
jgi:hypothetical protein